MPTETTPTKATTETDSTLPGSAEALLAASSAVPGLIRLPAGIELNEEQAEKMASERAVRLVVLAGAVACGKTTFLESVLNFFVKIVCTL